MEASTRNRRALRKRASPRLSHLFGQRRLRTSGRRRRGRTARRAIRRGTFQHGSRDRLLQSLLLFRSQQMHRVLALHPSMRRPADHPCLVHRWSRVRQQDHSGRGRSLHGFGLRKLRSLRKRVPGRRLGRKGIADIGQSRQVGSHHLRILRSGLSIRRRHQGQSPSDNEARRGLSRQQRPFLCKREVRFRLREPQGTSHHPHDPGNERRGISRGFMGRDVRFHFGTLEKNPRRIGSRRHRDDHLIPLDQ